MSWSMNTGACGCRGRLHGRPCQSALLDDKGSDLIDTFADLQICKNERLLRAHSPRVCCHHFEIRADQGSEIYLVDDEKIGAGNARTTLARYFFTCSYVNDVDGQACQLGAERCRKVVASGFDKAQFRMRELSVHVFDRGEIHGSIFPNRRMRTASCLDAHDALCRQRLRAREDELIFLCIYVIGDHVDVVVSSKSLTQRFDQSRFARPNRSANSDA